MIDPVEKLLGEADNYVRQSEDLKYGHQWVHGGIVGRLAAALREQRVPPWRPFDPEDKGTWPEEGVTVSVLFYGREPGMASHRNGDWFRQADVFDHYDVTHWMPLPAPPAVSVREEG